MTIVKFDPVIYPQKLWVCAGKDFKKLNGLFSDIDNKTDWNFVKYRKYKAITINAIEKKTGEFGVVIVFRPKYLNCKTIAHEASHAAGNIFHYIGADMDYGEPTAYLIEWIVDCCWKVKISKKRDKSKKQRKSLKVLKF
jgi:hypothetical protein